LREYSKVDEGYSGDILNVLFGLVEILLGYGLIGVLMLVLLSQCWLVACWTHLASD